VTQTFSALVDNRPGVLAEMAETFRRLSVNIKSISCGETEDPSVTRMVIRADCTSDEQVQEITDAMHAMAAVRALDDLSRTGFVDRELALVKVTMDKDTTTQLMQVFEVFRANVVGMGTESITVELTGDEERVTAFIHILAQYGIRSMCRTGVIALTRGDA
jgi:acetolactate synthase-1/3 small subunit